MSKESIEQNIMPEFHILPRVRDIGSWVVSKLAFIPDLGITHGDHFQKNTGASVMLDEQLSLDLED